MTRGRSRPGVPVDTTLPGRPNRLDRVARQLQTEISSIILRDIKDPRVHMSSITRVTVTPDLRTARVMVSALGDDAARRAAVSGLRHAAGFIRGTLADRLENLKTVPHLQFDLDQSIEYSVRISGMVRDLSGGDGSDNGDVPQGGEL